jgi:hypothetical protein
MYICIYIYTYRKKWPVLVVVGMERRGAGAKKLRRQKMRGC